MASIKLQSSQSGPVEGDSLRINPERDEGSKDHRAFVEKYLYYALYFDVNIKTGITNNHFNHVHSKKKICFIIRLQKLTL